MHIYTYGQYIYININTNIYIYQYVYISIYIHIYISIYMHADVGVMAHEASISNFFACQGLQVELTYAQSVVCNQICEDDHSRPFEHTNMQGHHRESVYFFLVYA